MPVVWQHVWVYSSILLVSYATSFTSRFILVYKAIHSMTPCYLNEMCIPVSTVPNLSALRSAARGDLVVPRTRLQLGNQVFCVAGPVARNSLPLHIRSAPTLSTFKNMLKTHLFSRFYFTGCFKSTSSDHCTHAALVVTLAIYLRLISCRFIIIILPSVVEIPRAKNYVKNYIEQCWNGYISSSGFVWAKVPKTASAL